MLLHILQCTTDYPAPVVNWTVVETLRWTVALRIPRFRQDIIPGPVDWKTANNKTPLTFVCSIYRHIWRVERNYGFSH